MDGLFIALTRYEAPPGGADGERMEAIQRATAGSSGGLGATYLLNKPG